MDNKKDPASQLNINQITEVIKVFGDVPSSLAMLIDLGTLYIYTHCIIINSLNNNIIIKFGTNEITFQANTNVVMDDFKFNDVIEYKYSSAPTAGNIQVICF